jgi:Zn-dependent M28 family amino/carboxypeptidase
MFVLGMLVGLSTVLVEVARNLLAKEAETGTVLSEWDVVIALFDGEEEGLLGSYLFVKDHPWMPKVRTFV